MYDLRISEPLKAGIGPARETVHCGCEYVNWIMRAFGAMSEGIIGMEKNAPMRA